MRFSEMEWRFSSAIGTRNEVLSYSFANQEARLESLGVWGPRVSPTLSQNVRFGHQSRRSCAHRSRILGATPVLPGNIARLGDGSNFACLWAWEMEKKS